ncbi:MAG: Bacterial type secretion system protein domain protein [Ilumatobacteraceae bacterium]|nr:Bacterial type secretion system protein domain protein [Ilumatobacteraceae bacterium]
MSPIVLVGPVAGAGLFLVVRGFTPAPLPLSTALRRLDRSGHTVDDVRTAAEAVRPSGLSDRAAALISGRLGSRIESDLVVVDRTPQSFAAEKLVTALSLAGIVVALAVALGLAGTPLPTGLTFVLAVGALGGGFVTPDLTLRSQAKNRRDGFRHALSSYLDLVNVLLAGGAGIETSLEAAAQAGDGWAFVQLRNALVRSRTMRQSPWMCFTELGQRIEVIELVEIAASVQLAGEQGARVKLSLAAKASALRAHQMARIEADAQSATERMGIPTVLMFIGFIVLLGYPAMQQIVTAL